MLRLLLFSVILLIGLNAGYSQQQYTVDGTTYTLETEVEGPISLLWGSVDGQFRYFLKKGNDIVELKNTRDGRDYREEYKEVLREQTSDVSMNVSQVDLTLASLESFFHSYNKRKDPSYTYDENPTDFRFRLGVFGGMMNNVYYINPGNDLLFQGGVDFEMIENVMLKRHSLVLQFRQVFPTSDYDFSSTQISLNYRWKFVKTESVDVFANVKVASYTYFTRDLENVPVDGGTINLDESRGSLQGPLALGVGADIPVGNGFISIAYNDFVAILLDNNGDFPVDFTVGYKFRL